MIYDISTGKPVVAQDRGLVVVDALTAYGDVSYVIVSAVGYLEDEQSVAEAKRLFELYKAAPEMLEALGYVAAIAHEGGLIGMHEADAMVAIRKLSRRWWNLSRSKSESIEALNSAIAKAKGEQP